MLTWFTEASDQDPDPQSGARITRLTSAVCHNNNIYCEQPYCSKDGNRVAIVRQSGMDACRTTQCMLLVTDLNTLRSTLVEECIDDMPCTAAWSGFIYYMRQGHELVRLSLDTLDKEIISTSVSFPPDMSMGSVSPDQRYLIGQAVLSGPTIGVVRMDLESGEWTVIFEHPEITNTHLQYNPVNGKDILVQHNRGSKMAPDGTLTSPGDIKQGTTLFVLDAEGGNQRSVPAGQPATAGITGHECFVGDTGRVAFTVVANADGSLDSRYPQGNLFTAAPGDEKPTVFATPEHYFNHLCVSRCGRYFVCDSYPDGLPGPVPLVVGNFETGKYALLVEDVTGILSGAQYTHPHAYFTTDTRHVIYNANPQGVPHVFKADIPDGFLENLD